MEQIYYSIGVDVGGTNSDCVILKHINTTHEVVGRAKALTTADFITGIKQCIQQAFLDSDLKGHKLSEYHISAFMLGTTTFLNAVLERSKELSKVINEFIHELENVSPENLCECKACAVRLLDCLMCILRV